MDSLSLTLHKTHLVWSDAQWHGFGSSAGDLEHSHLPPPGPCLAVPSNMPWLHGRSGNTHNKHEWLCHMPPDTLQQLSLMVLLEGGVGSPQVTDWETESWHTIVIHYRSWEFSRLYWSPDVTQNWYFLWYGVDSQVLALCRMYDHPSSASLSIENPKLLLASLCASPGCGQPCTRPLTLKP